MDPPPSPELPLPSPTGHSRIVLWPLWKNRPRAERARFSCPSLFHWSHPAFQRVSPFHPIKLCNSLFIAFRCNYSIIGLSSTHSFTMKAASYRADISQILSIPVCALTRLSIRSTTRPGEHSRIYLFIYYSSLFTRCRQVEMFVVQDLDIKRGKKSTFYCHKMGKVLIFPSSFWVFFNTNTLLRVAAGWCRHLPPADRQLMFE